MLYSLLSAFLMFTPDTATSGNTFEAVATAYVANCKGCSGITRDGTKADYRKAIIAVDPRVIPLGSVVQVTFPDGKVKTYTARDTGGKIKGARIDILVKSRSEAINFGRQIVKIKIIGKK